VIFASSFGLESRGKNTNNYNTIFCMGEIITKQGGRVKLAKLFGVSEVTIRSALKERTKSELATKIRKVAKDNGGVEIELKK